MVISGDDALRGELHEIRDVLGKHAAPAGPPARERGVEGAASTVTMSAMSELYALLSDIDKEPAATADVEVSSFGRPFADLCALSNRACSEPFAIENVSCDQNAEYDKECANDVVTSAEVSGLWVLFADQCAFSSRSKNENEDAKQGENYTNKCNFHRLSIAL